MFVGVFGGMFEWVFVRCLRSCLGGWCWCLGGCSKSGEVE